MHKRVADKVRLVNTPNSAEDIEFGREDWKVLAMER
jgi:hypothetical protein